MQIIRRKGYNHKLRRSAKNQKSGKYRLQFIRTVSRIGKWRGKKAEIHQAF